MRFLKIGHRYVNVDMITDVYVQEDLIEVYLAAPMGLKVTSEAPPLVQTRHLHFSGKEAQQLVRWLDAHRIDEDE